MPIIAVGLVDDAQAFYTDKLGLSRLMVALGEEGKLSFATAVLGARTMFSRAQASNDETLDEAHLTALAGQQLREKLA